MATIAENLQTLNETKANIKMAIEAKGQDLTDVPFTQYAEKINNIQAGGSGGEIKRLFDGMKTMNRTFFYSDIEDYSSYLEEKDTENVIGLWYTWGGCSKLRKIPRLDLQSCNTLDVPFNGCAALEEVYFCNIRSSVQVASGTTYGHLLTIESLIHLIGELRDVGLSKTLTIGSANLEKLANVYVKPIDITDEMRAEDDFIDQKLPFVVCDSTDEGACPIVDYANYKNWQVI